MTQSWTKSPKKIALICAGVINVILIYLIYRDFSTFVTTLGTTGDPGANSLRWVLLILFLGVFDVSLVVIFFWKSVLVRIGILVTVAPIICAFLYSLLKGGSMFDESAGGGAFLWLLILTLPIGLILIAVGVIVELNRRPKS
jgi:hypothetical protein